MYKIEKLPDKNYSIKLNIYFVKLRVGRTSNKHVHSPQECLASVACLWSKMPMFQRAGMREGGLPLPLAFQYVILVIWRACDLNLAIISSLALKCTVFYSTIWIIFNSVLILRPCLHTYAWIYYVDVYFTWFLWFI